MSVIRALISLSLLTVAIGLAQAQQTTYVYTPGSTYTNLANNEPPAGTFTLDMSVTGSFSVSSMLPTMSFGDISVLVTSYSFDTGRNTLTEANSSIFRFSVAVDASGEITDWDVLVSEVFPNPGANIGDQRALAWLNMSGVGPPDGATDFGQLEECTLVMNSQCRSGITDWGSVRTDMGGVPGSWSIMNADSDGDGVDNGSDYCPGTVIPEGVPSKRLLKLRYALVDGDGTFDTTEAGGRQGPNRSYTIEDTAGCSCEQILDALGLGEDEGQLMFGCAISVMDEWVEFVNP